MGYYGCSSTEPPAVYDLGVAVQACRESDGDEAIKCQKRPERTEEMHIAMLDTV